MPERATSSMQTYPRLARTLPKGPNVGTLTSSHYGTTVYYTFLMLTRGCWYIHSHLVHLDGTISRRQGSVYPDTNSVVHEFGTIGAASIRRSLTSPLRWLR